MAVHTVTSGNLGKKAGAVRFDRKKNSGRGPSAKNNENLRVLLAINENFYRRQPFRLMEKTASRERGMSEYWLLPSRIESLQ
ncbi:hypothetical protein [Azospirillum argentinense]|uniref:hypothetical protein n=1 Tax=Azospirillum argentinense TaxID=2970906 RepID=UPI0010C03B3A|nr:hypothetical protein [Azospirillum argentinense]